MPRRNVTRCPRRGSSATIDYIEEVVLTHGHAWGVAAWEELLRSRHAFARAWGRWRDELTARWIAAYPGSRPMAAYVTGEIPAPDLAHELPALRHPVILEGTVVIADRGHWHRQVAELEYLDGLGLLDDGEYALAVERLDGPDPVGTHRYRSVADEGEKSTYATRLPAVE